jgi:hypothetical protein
MEENMNRPSRFALSLIPALALAAAALPARADDDHHRRGRHDDCDRHAPPVVVAPPVAYPVPAPVVVAPPAYYPAPARPAPVWKQAHWNRGWQFRELRREYQELDAARDRFYATWRGNPWRRDRFESWYAGRHAELDQRRAELERGYR